MKVLLALVMAGCLFVASGCCATGNCGAPTPCNSGCNQVAPCSPCGK